MKVLMLNPALSGSGYTHNLCNALADQGCEVHLFTGPHWQTVGRYWAEVRYHPQIYFYRRTQEPSYRPGARGAVWKVLRLIDHLWEMVHLAWIARGFDVIHVQFLGLPALDVAWLWLVSRYRPVVYTVHNLYPHDALRNRWTRMLWTVIYRAPAALVAHITATADGLRADFHVPAPRIAQLRFGNYHHLATMTRSASPGEIGLDRPGVVLLFGDIRKNKGIDVLLAAAAQLKARRIDCCTVIAGGRGDGRPYQDLARRLELDDVVQFRTGFINEHEVPAYFRAAAIVVLPYRVIDQSAVAVAACSLGKALIASDIAGLREIVREADNGILVPPDDPEALATALACLLSDEPLRSRYEANSRRYAREALAWGPIARDTIGVYRRVAAPEGQEVQGTHP